MKHESHGACGTAAKAGRKPKELVELGFPKRVVTRVSRRLRKEKAALNKKAPKGPAQGETQTPTSPESPEAMVVAIARYLGAFRRQDCRYQQDGLCHLWTWASQDEIPAGAGEAVQVGDQNPEWYVKPSPLYCAMCTIPIEDRVDDVESEVSGNPLSGVKYRFTCSSCGSKGWIAAKIKCTKCGDETYWGWWPKKE